VFDISELPRPIIRYGVGLWRRRWIVVAGAWAAALFGWFAIWLLPDKYESRAQVNVQTESILEPVMNGITARPNYEQRVEVMRQQLLTRPNVEEIIYRAGLDKTVKARSELDRRVKMEKLIDWVASEIKIESPQNLYFVISYRFGDPVMARNVVDAVLNLLIEQDLGASLAEKEEARRLLDQQIGRFDERLTAKEREVAEFRRGHADELAAVEGDVRERERLESDLARINEQMSQAQSRVATLQNVLVSTPRVSAGSELDQLKVQLAQLRSQYEESYPDIQVIKARIAQLESAGVGALPDNPEYIRTRNELSAAQDQLTALKARERQTRAGLEAQAVTLGEAPGVEAELQRIIRDYEQMQKTYEELVQRRDRLALTSSLGAGGQGVEYQVFERPTVALTPASPPRLVFILGVFILAFGAGAGAALGFTYFDRTFTQTGDLKEKFGLPVLGSITAVSSNFAKELSRKDLLRLAAACAGLGVVALIYIYLSVLRLPAGAEAADARSASLITHAGAGPWG
jgi:polysaccharide chain length determinant protein (PEP-CTERM system associated)